MLVCVHHHAGRGKVPMIECGSPSLVPVGMEHSREGLWGTRLLARLSAETRQARGVSLTEGARTSKKE